MGVIEWPNNSNVIYTVIIEHVFFITFPKKKKSKGCAHGEQLDLPEVGGDAEPEEGLLIKSDNGLAKVSALS